MNDDTSQTSGSASSSSLSSVTKAEWKIILLSCLGGALEFYDFVIYAIYAIVIGVTFFPNDAGNAIASMLAAFVAFGIGYLVRPLGGFIFAHYGDRYGRKKAFVVSIAMMAGATFLMGILPGYDTLGVMATVLFVIFRIAQGLAVGGEIPGAITFVKEHIQHRPGLACGFLFLFINLGILLADGVHLLLSDLPQTLAWRIAFILGGFLAILSYFLRKKLQETQLFITEAEKHRVPFFVLFQKHVRKLIFGFCIVAMQGCLVSMVYLYVPPYLLLLKYTAGEVAFLTMLNLAVFSVFCAIVGYISDYLGQRYIFLLGCLAMIPASFWFYQSCILHQNVMLSYLVLSVVCGFIGGTFSAHVAKAFPTDVRYSGVAFCYNVAFAILGGLTPAIASYYHLHYQSLLAPSYILMVAAGLGIIGILGLWNSGKTRLND